MALMAGQLYEALRAGNVPDDKARAPADEVANYEGELTKLRTEFDERMTRLEGSLRLVQGMVGFVGAVVLGVLGLVWQILLRLPS
jgi:hypothetical protein